jgi:hypothetical protein
MKHPAPYITPAEAGYYTTQQWDSAFRPAFEVLRSDARTRQKTGVRLIGKRFGLQPSLSSTRNIHQPTAMTQEATTHGKVR